METLITLIFFIVLIINQALIRRRQLKKEKQNKEQTIKGNKDAAAPVERKGAGDSGEQRIGKKKERISRKDYLPEAGGRHHKGPYFEQHELISRKPRVSTPSYDSSYNLPDETPLREHYRPDAGETASVRGRQRIQSMSELKRAYLWSEILRAPAALRKEPLNLYDDY